MANISSDGGVGGNTPPISKPYWLQSWLGNLNWDILGWHIDVGNAVEIAIDWVLDPVNNIITFARTLYDDIINVWTSLVNTASWLDSEIKIGLGNLSSSIGSWWSNLDTWWDSKWTDILAFGQTIKGYTDSLFATVKADANNLFSMWDDFYHDVYPYLAKFTDLADLKTSILSDISDVINFVGNYKKIISDFFTDPIQWIADRLEQIIERIW